ncbi:phosphatidate cytidylyltransferase [Catenovulum sp. 2E275]|uniref:phosphatidate cytidylyltransferase n=1 Tax=Catenovulum sp. 2E275 TaxID=2980497 RepID=UPI0021D35924|nr:phosphatidate cytidylyltransferase [Catenovulum sp. 2E275]MCU4675739.1 phosphatidate cytidylyltransferase [Catenovulum sp. 2E275]
MKTLKTNQISKSSTLKKRILTALILLPLALIAIFELPLIPFAIFTAIVMSIGAWEWGPFIGFCNKRRRVVLMGALVGSMFGFAKLSGLIDYGQINLYQPQVETALWISLAWWALALLLVVTYPKSSRYWRGLRWIKGLFGLFTLLPAWLAINIIRANQYELDVQNGAWLLLYVFALVWAADIGAYFAGKAFGKRKLMPNVSPGKTLEGFAGGVVASTTLIFLALQTPLFVGHNGLEVVLISLAVVFSSVLGDLLESMLKRQAGIKDSGTILPGHGGVLDRIDSLTAALPVFACLYFYLV